ncbi:hypothetical protein C9374_008030 [Naegleria lovaniensis]|uniref:Uncharacterized protein n=1 Tax=Naegleria lovaniensis TaxID=51637 RepID=A0AA88KG47_NAELO|nr:uncharacterized protein C9374_008030 [Naegleria lovaniensis]KAG2378882.1 hypothetical protein C9374_008030 [Naegleria lovaniensis]
MPTSILYTVDYDNKQEISSGGLLIGPKIYEVGSFRKQTNHEPLNNFEEHSNSNIQPCKRIVIDGIKIVKVISGRIHTHIITDLGRVYSCGLNSGGCLGCGFDGDIELNGHTGGYKKRGLVATVGPMTNHVVVDGSCGGYHSLFLTQDNVVYVCGKNSSQQCGFSDIDSIPTPKALSSSYFNNSKILSVAGGNSYSIFVAENGVYACGNDSNGSCAGHRSRYPVRITSFPSNETPLIAKCGYDNTSIWCASGAVYGWGCNSSGQMMEVSKHGTHENSPIVRRVFCEDPIQDITCGYFCAAVKTRSTWFLAPGGHGVDIACIDNIFKEKDSIIAVCAGDYIVFVTNQPNTNSSLGRVFMRHRYAAKQTEEITGEFELPHPNAKVEISALRNGYIIYFPDGKSIDKAFMFMKNLLTPHENQNYISDVKIVTNYH